MLKSKVVLSYNPKRKTIIGVIKEPRKKLFGKKVEWKEVVSFDVELSGRLVRQLKTII